eukprot:4558355-Prymnesium_polylepis.1
MIQDKPDGRGYGLMLVLLVGVRAAYAPQRRMTAVHERFRVLASESIEGACEPLLTEFARVVVVGM